MTHEWTAAEVAALPVVVDVPTAGAVLGLGRTSAYEQVRAGTFPVKVLRLGSQYRVPTAGLRALLGLEAPPAATSGP